MNVQQDHVLHSRDGKFDNDTSQLADVPRLLGAAFAAAPQHGLLIHFHGGLVSQKSGRGVAESLAPKYLAAGTYPLFFVWESGLIESLKNNLADIRADPAFRELTKKAAEWALKKLGGEAGLKGGAGQAVNEDQLRKEFDRWFNGAAPQPPVSDSTAPPPAQTTKGAAGLDEDELADDIEAGLDSDPDFQNAIQALHNAVGGGGAPTKGAGTQARAKVVLIDEQALKTMFPGSSATTKGALSWLAVAKFVAKMVIRVARRYAAGRAHGMYCTIVEEVLRAAYLDKVGTTVWNQMKNDTVDSFGSDPQCCGSAVLKELGRLQAAGKTFDKVTLVGHSTGAVYICEWLDAAATVAPNLKFDIVFLAPAVRHERFAAALAAHRARIGKFRTFGMSDAIESDDALVPILYTRSLLYFVSGVLEGHTEGAAWEDDIDAPIVGMQRYLTDKAVFSASAFPAVDQVRAFLLSIPDAAVWSDAQQGNGLNSLSHKHGDFDNDEETLKSVAWFIAH